MRARGVASWVAAVAFVPVALLLIHQWSWPPHALSGDHAQYLSHAHALLTGRPYGDIGYLFHEAAWDVGPPAYPPGFPLTLVPLIAAAGDNHLVLRLASVGFAVLAIFAFVHAVPREVPRWQALLAGAITLFAMEASGGLLVPLSDPGFCLLFWSAVWTLRDPGPWTWPRVATLTALGALAMAYRVVGVVLIPIVVASAAVTWRTHRGRALWPAVIWIGGGVIALASGRAPYPQLLGLVGHIDQSRVTDILTAARFALLELLAYPLPWDAANDAYHLLAACGLLAGGITIARRWGRHPAVIAAGGYVAMLLVAPISEPRYYWPLFPVLALALVMGMHDALGRWRSAHASRVSVAAIVALLSAAVVTRWHVPPPAALVGSPDGEEMLAWVRNASTPSMRVAFRNPRVLTLETGVPAMAPGDVTALGQLAMFDERAITHVVVAVTGELECKDHILRGLVDRARDRLVHVWENASYEIYELRPGAPVPRNAWEAIDWNRREAFCS